MASGDEMVHGVVDGNSCRRGQQSVATGDAGCGVGDKVGRLVSGCFEPSQPQMNYTRAKNKPHSISNLFIPQVIIPQVSFPQTTTKNHTKPINSRTTLSTRRPKNIYIKKKKERQKTEMQPRMKRNDVNTVYFSDIMYICRPAQRVSYYWMNGSISQAVNQMAIMLLIPPDKITNRQNLFSDWDWICVSNGSCDSPDETPSGWLGSKQQLGNQLTINSDGSDVTPSGWLGSKHRLTNWL